MAIVATLLAQGNSTSNATVYTTSSVTPAASSITLVAVSHVANTPPATCIGSIIGSGVRYLPLALAIPDGYATGTRARVLEVWAAATNSPGAGALTIDFLGSNTQTGIAYGIVSLTGTGIAANTDSALRSVIRGISWLQGNGTVATITVNMPNPRAAGNASIFAFAHASNEATTVGGGLTELADQNNADAGGFEISWVNAAVSSGAASWATASASAGIGIEVAVAGNTGFTTSPSPEATLNA